MEKDFKVVIYTPFGKYLSITVDYLSVKSGVGVIGILPNHAPLITTLEISKLILRNNKTEYIYAIGGGVLHVKNDHSVTLLVDSIEGKNEIDINRAKASRDRANERLNSSDHEIDVKRAKLSLLRALNRLEVSDNNN